MSAIQNLTQLVAASCTDINRICLNNLPQPTSAGPTFVQSALTIVIGITAALSVLFIAIGGARYIFSQGDPGAVTKAKSTIMFALIGLIVAIFAQLLVVFVINKVSA